MLKSYDGHEQIVRLLVDAKANMNILKSGCNHKKWGALECAAENNSGLAILRLLIEWGADIRIRDNAGETSFQLISPLVR